MNTHIIRRVKVGEKHRYTECGLDVRGYDIQTVRSKGLVTCKRCLKLPTGKGNPYGRTTPNRKSAS